MNPDDMRALGRILRYIRLIKEGSPLYARAVKVAADRALVAHLEKHGRIRHGRILGVPAR